jgi:hypothetical protein
MSGADDDDDAKNSVVEQMNATVLLRQGRREFLSTASMHCEA